MVLPRHTASHFKRRHIFRMRNLKESNCTCASSTSPPFISLLANNTEHFLLQGKYIDIELYNYFAFFPLNWFRTVWVILPQLPYFTHLLALMLKSTSDFPSNIEKYYPLLEFLSHYVPNVYLRDQSIWSHNRILFCLGQRKIRDMKWVDFNSFCKLPREVKN